jgi:NOL1/NOP2/sun family putative RNA methylase
VSDYLDRYRDIVDDWAAFMETVATPLPTTIWANPLKTTPDALQRRMAADGVQLKPVGWRPGTFRLDRRVSPGTRMEFMAGHYQVQEEAALPAVDLMEPVAGERVIDLCAAPGNKSAQLAVAMNGQGMVVANDKSYGRLRAVRAAIDRLGLVNIAITNRDAITFPNLFEEPEAFDRVLADVPCTCEGTLRKNPTALELAEKTNIKELAGVQASILRRGINLCRPGGLIVYATCTFAPEENEAVIQRMFNEFGESIDLEPALIDGFKSAPGLTRWKDERYDDRMTTCMRVWPHHNDTGGFFVARIRKAKA